MIQSYHCIMCLSHVEVLSVFQVFVNFAKQQGGEYEDITLHRRTAGGRKDVKIAPAKRKT